MKDAPKFTYKLQLSYKGSQYSGWQYQTVNPETVQQHVESVLAKIVNYQDFQVIGASRTDTGVHATGQALKVTLPKQIDPDKLTRGMNSKLPRDIRVVSSELADEKINVNRDSKFKEYHYYFTVNKSENAIFSEIVYSFPNDLDIQLMQRACASLVGEHNFESFCVPGPNPTSTRRTILECSIEKTNFLTLEQDIYFLKIQGTGFLKYMVRYLMGAIWDIGAHKLSHKDFTQSLTDGQKHGLRTKAPAHGLNLHHIKY